MELNCPYLLSHNVLLLVNEKSFLTKKSTHLIGMYSNRFENDMRNE